MEKSNFWTLTTIAVVMSVLLGTFFTSPHMFFYFGAMFFVFLSDILIDEFKKK